MLAPILLAACLKKAGISALGIDFNIKFIEKFGDHPHWSFLRQLLTSGYLHNQKFPRRLLIDILKFVRHFLLELKYQHNPEWIGLSIFTSESLDFAHILSYYIRKYLPDTKIIAGGKGLEVVSSLQGPSPMNYEVFYNSGMVDAVVVGDAENEIINTIQNDLTGIIYAKQQTKQDLDNIPIPSWEDYNLNKYLLMERYRENNDNFDNKSRPYLTVTSSKGCVRNCSFCDVASFWPEFIFRDPVKVAEEIIANYRATGIRDFQFTDNLMNGSITGYRKLNEILAREIPKEISYLGYAIFRAKQSMPKADFDLAALAGCTEWQVGVESGSEKVRFDMKKKFSNDDIDWCATNLHRVGIKQVWLMFVGYPTETEEDFEQTLELLRRYAPLSANGMIELNLGPTLQLNSNAPLLQDSETSTAHGVAHNKDQIYYSSFWTSTVNPKNTFPTRVRRWKTFYNISQELGYTFNKANPLHKHFSDLEAQEEMYKEYAKKQFQIIPIHPAQ